MQMRQQILTGSTHKRFALTSFLVLFVLSACGSPGKNSGDGADIVQAQPDRGEIMPFNESEGIETIVVMGTNDIHGAIASETRRTREAAGTEPIEYKAGGMAILASYLKVLRSEFGNRLLWLDAGDEFQGTIESNRENGKPLVKFFNFAGLQGAAVGNHEFDYGAEPAHSTDLLSALKNRMSEALYPYLAANIFEKGTDKLADFPNTYPSKLYSVGRLKVGVIGLSTRDTPKTTRPTNVATLDFTDLKEATLRESRKLRSAGADMVLITAHVGLFCEVGRAPLGWAVRKETDSQGECRNDDELVKLLRAIPAGTVDAVVSGHSHQIIHHWIAGVPVIQGGSSGRYFNLIYLHYDVKNKKLLRDRSRVEGPVPVCPAVFKNQNDCNGDRPAPPRGRGPLVAYNFHGQTIEADSASAELMRPALEAAELAKKEVLGQAARAIEHDRIKESPLGNLVTDAVKDATQADVVLLNGGGIRAPLEQGSITFGNVFRVLPFDNALVTMKVTGRELMTILRVAESGSRGFSPVAGLTIKLIARDHDAPSDDLNGDRRIDPWETNRILSVKLADGSPIQPDRMYTLATIDFLATGGDDVGWALQRIPLSRIHFTSVLLRDAAVAYIKKVAAHGPINTLENPTLDPARPRLTFEKVDNSNKKKHFRSHKKKRAKAS